MKDYTEQKLVEEPAIHLFQSLDYEHLNCYNEKFGTLSTLGRETSAEVVLKTKLREAIECLNDGISVQATNLAIQELTKDRSTQNPVNANKEIYEMIRNGVKVTIRTPEGKEKIGTVKIIDFAEPSNNDFFLASQFWITGEIYKKRADLIGFVNGLPLIFIELKASYRDTKIAYDNNLRDYKNSIPQLFWYNAFIILSNGSKTKIGSMSAEYGHFNEWKKINSEGEEGIISLETAIEGTCEQQIFLDIFENFILFEETDGANKKIISKNHQYLGVNNAVEKFKNNEQNINKLGVFWHTQGSGKSFSMIFFTQKILRKFKGNYTFVIVTDRKSLDKQIFKNFVNVGAVTEEKEVHADSCEELKQLLSENHRYVFTLIHKFQTKKGEIYPVLSSRSDIIVITDEAHRTQYDVLAMNMRRALPNASFIAFTATPLIIG